MADLEEINAARLEELKKQYKADGWPVPKWLQFCEAMLHDGWTVRVYRAQTTISKYVHITKGRKRLKVRFSNHRASWRTEAVGDSDIYVGVGNRGTITTEQVIEIIRKGEV